MARQTARPMAFEKKLEVWHGHIPLDMSSALVYVNDTLDFCASIGETIFGDKSNPEVVIAIYRLVVDRENLDQGEVV